MLRSRSVLASTVLALLAGSFGLLTTAIQWLLVSSTDLRSIGVPITQNTLLASRLIPSFLCVSTLLIAIGLFRRQNWARVFAILLGLPLAIWGWTSLKSVLLLRAIVDMRHPLGLPTLFWESAVAFQVFQIAAGVCWILLLTGSRAKAEFSPVSATTPHPAH